MAVIDAARAADNATLSCLDALETSQERGSLALRLWASLWPKVAALL